MVRFQVLLVVSFSSSGCFFFFCVLAIDANHLCVAFFAPVRLWRRVSFLIPFYFRLLESEDADSFRLIVVVMC
eukprot:m.928136 g.928136  ORF g.928136 m.928136 type:complete len:73 (-) comp155460_c0_seq1:28-246(-)